MEGKVMSFGGNIANGGFDIIKSAVKQSLIFSMPVYNDFVKNIEPFIGYEKQLNVINSIYHGLQSLANAYPDNNSDNSEMTKKNVSTKLRSQLIDEYINDLLEAQNRRNYAKSMQQKLYNKSKDS